MHSHVIQRIADTLGLVEDIDLIKDKSSWRECVHVQISLDITKQLPRGKRVVVGASEVIWMHFKYEHLPIFCYCCQQLGHGDRDCVLWLNKRT